MEDEYRFCRAFSHDFQLENINNCARDFAEFFKKELGYDYHVSEKNTREDKKFSCTFSGIALSINITFINGMGMNFLSAYFPNEDLKAKGLKFCQDNFGFYSYETLLASAESALHTDGRWLIALVKGTIDDDDAFEDICELIEEGFDSDNEQTRRFAIVAACIDESYDDEFVDEIEELSFLDPSQLVRDTAKEMMEMVIKRPLQGDLFS